MSGDSKNSKSFSQPLSLADPDIFRLVQAETRRQSTGLELIASENFVSEAVLQALGTTLTNKYAEGYPGKRYYGGCEFVDEVETLAIDRAKSLFGADYINVQAHSGSQANMAVYFAVCKPGDTLLTMDLSHGGHLTHGHKINFSGKFYNIVSYGVRRETGLIDMNQIETLAQQHKPRVIVAGASNYCRKLDYAAFRQIADKCGALLMADMAHPAGLIAAKLHPDPVPYCDFVTSTTHKTLRGPRGGLVMSREVHAQPLRSTLFPGIQGGPLMHVIAAKAVAFGEALKPEFKQYAKAVIENAQTLAATVMEDGYKVLTGGTDTHLFSIDLSDQPITGKEAEAALGTIEITVNKNMVPFDQRPPMITSGIRLGTPALTTRGMGKKEMQIIGKIITRKLREPSNESLQTTLRREVHELCEQFPIYQNRLS